jgi:hypothetical protein
LSFYSIFLFPFFLSLLFFILCLHFTLHFSAGRVWIQPSPPLLLGQARAGQLLFEQHRRPIQVIRLCGVGPIKLFMTAIHSLSY